MPPYACPLVAGILMFAFPPEAFSGKGLRSPAGIARFLGHACLAGAPGALLLWACPGMPEIQTLAAGATLGGFLAVALMLLGPLFQRPYRPVPRDLPPSVPAPGSPEWIKAKVVEVTPTDGGPAKLVSVR